MGEHSKAEWNLLLPVLAMVSFPGIRMAMGFEAIESAFLDCRRTTCSSSQPFSLLGR